MEDLIPHEEKTKRFAALAELQGKISDKINNSYVGKTITVLADSHCDKQSGIVTARSEGNKIIRIETDKEIYGRFVKVKIERAESRGLFAKLI